MKRILLLLIILYLCSGLKAQTSELLSPNGELKISVRIADKIYYSVSCQDEVLLKDCHLQLRLKGDKAEHPPQLTGQKRVQVNETIQPVVPLKFSSVSNHYNQLQLQFKGNYMVEFRAFDEGVAYRFVTNHKGEVDVMGEDNSLQFPSQNYLLHLQQPGSFKTAYEELYTRMRAQEWKAADRMATLPLLIDTQKEYKILICESDLHDYPCMFLKADGKGGIQSVFPKAPLAFGEDGDRSLKITQEADYIARTAGNRTYPWRYFVIARNDGQLITNTMSCKLAGPSRLTDTSWLKPGQASWEWWNDASPYGPDVNFVSGYNLETYKYYIDFASKFGIPYIIMDEGWAKSTRDPYTPNPKVDVHEIIRYGKEKNVGVVLWLTWLTVEKNFDLFKTFREWGVKGVKIDFMDRSDQWMVNYYERVAKAAADNQLFVDFHGSFKPVGLEYDYPNILAYEGVRGMEQMGGCYPDNSIYFPFMRNAVGTMDYTPGAMNSMQPNVYKADRPNAGSIGTRAYQMALFVIFESGIQMLADNPTLYYRNRECTEFISQVPVTWDETRVLEAKVGEYVIVAKRKGDEWFIGGMTNNREKERAFTLSLDFLEEGKAYTMTSFEDGINAGRQAMDYRKKDSKVNRNQKVSIKMVRNGGWAAVIRKDTGVDTPAVVVDEFYHTPRGTYEERKKQFLDYCVTHGERKQRIGIFTQMARLMSGMPVEEALVQDAIDKIRSNWDCNDFSLNGLLRMAYMEKKKPQLSPLLAKNVEACILDFKYWWDDARRDTTYRCYHTENHQALYHTAELLAGQLYKDRTFTNGLTGAEHVRHAERLILPWLDYRFRFGFSEWLSSYYEVEILLLTNLYDYAENSVIRERARMVLDVLMFDLALGNFHGMLSTTSGRIYASSLVTGHHTMSPTLKLIFGEGIYLPHAIMSNVALCGSTYRCPQVIQEVAVDYSKPMLNRQKVSIEVDDAEKYGLSCNKEEDVNLFWGMQEFIHPKVIRMSKQVSEKHDVYPYRNYNDYIRRYDEQMAKYGKIVNNRLDRFALSESNLETYRTNDYMMSCSFDYRKGAIAYQQHIWQATLDNQASVFTTHPGRKGLGGSPNYWGGSAVLPRAVQHKNVVICIYNMPNKEGMSMTHAYFPKEDFDEVIEMNGWVFGRKANGYVALYSQHAAVWQPNENGKVNDYAVAGRQNSWICEVGSAQEWKTFRQFINAISQATVACNGLDVTYLSPTIGKMEFGWEAPFLLQGKVMPLKSDYRYDNPYCKAQFNTRELAIRNGKKELQLNFETLRRVEK